MYEILIRHEEYVTCLKENFCYQSFDRVIQAMKRREKELKVPQDLTSYGLIDYIEKMLIKTKDERIVGKRITKYGPFGLRAYSSLYIKDAEKDDQICGHLTVEADEYRGCYRYETSQKINAYPKGSIGEMNRMNIVTKELSNNILDVLDLIFSKK